MTIELLSQSAYRGFQEKVASPGIEPSHIARVQFGDGVTRRAYVKLYPPNVQGLANEIAGQLLGRSLGLPVPSRAAVLMVPREAIPDPPTWLDGTQPTVPSWCVQDMAAPSIKFAFDFTNPDTWGLVRAELSASPQTPGIIAFDDWLANIDRNLGNLLRLAQGRYMLIDHGQAFGGCAWMPASLIDAARPFANKLRDILADKAQTPVFDGKLADCCRGHAAALDQVRPELLHWWSLTLFPHEQAPALAFLTARAEAPNICRRYRLLL